MMIYSIQKDPQHQLYYKSMGKLFRVTFICSTDEEANRRMTKYPEEALIGIIGELKVIANKHESEVVKFKKP